MSRIDDALDAVKHIGKPVLVCDHIPQMLLHVPDDDEVSSGGGFRYLRRCVLCNAEIKDGLSCH